MYRVVIEENYVRKVVYENADPVKVLQKQGEYVAMAKTLEKQWKNPKKKNPQTRITYVGVESYGE